MELVIVFVLVFIIYGAGWIWQTVSDLFREAPRSAAAGTPVAGRRAWDGVAIPDLRKAWARFAEQRDGQALDRVPFEPPRVAWVHRNSRAVLSVQEAGDSAERAYTQVTYTMPAGWTTRLEVFPQKLGPEAPGLLAFEDLEVGDPEFDPRFVVKSSDPDFARKFFDAPTRRAVEDLRSLRRNDHVLVSLNSSRLMVRKLGVLAAPADLDVFAGLADALLDRVLVFWQKASGIEIVDEPAGADAGEVHCQVCGHPIPGDNRVVCRKCRTPHHEDCWTFNEGCSTYACGEKKFLKK